VDSTWPNLTKIGPSDFQRLAQANRRRGVEASPEMQGPRQRRQATAGLVLENHLVEAVAARNTQDFGEAEKSHGWTGRVGKERVYTETRVIAR
jgi:hypothetical protein